MRIPLFAVVLAVQSVSAQVVSPLITGTNVNGRYWNTLSAESKATFIIGVSEGMMEVTGFGLKDCNCAFDATMNAMQAISGGDTSSYMELVEGVNDFFKDSTNRAVPVVKALTYVTLKIRGGTSKELDELLAKLRKGVSR